MQHADSALRPALVGTLLDVALVAFGVWIATDGQIALGSVLAAGGLVVLGGDLSSRIREIINTPLRPVLAWAALSIAVFVDFGLALADGMTAWRALVDLPVAVGCAVLALRAWRKRRS
jgi:hypothetical protein